MGKLYSAHCGEVECTRVLVVEPGLKGKVEQ
jgi:hypothetical protein